MAQKYQDMVARLIGCLAVALAGGVAAFVLWFAIEIWLVRNSPDGQAGMIGAIRALFFGGPIGALLGYGFEYWRSSRETQP